MYINFKHLSKQNFHKTLFHLLIVMLLKQTVLYSLIIDYKHVCRFDCQNNIHGKSILFASLW